MFDNQVKVKRKFVCWRLLRRAVVSRVGHFGQVREQFLRSRGVAGWASTWKMITCILSAA